MPADVERLTKVLDQRPVLWVGAGASMAAGYPSTGRILQWLDKLPAARRQTLKPWRPLMKQAEWQAAREFRWDERAAGEILGRAPIRPLVLNDHQQLGSLFVAAAERLAPQTDDVRLGPPSWSRTPTASSSVSWARTIPTPGNWPRCCTPRRPCTAWRYILRTVGM